MKRFSRLSVALSAVLTLFLLCPNASLADGNTYTADSDLSFAAAWLLCGSGDTIEVIGPVSISSGSYGTLDKSISVSGGSLTLSGGSYLVTANISGAVSGGSDVSVFVSGGGITLTGGTVYAPVSSLVPGFAGVTQVKYADGSSEAVTSYHGDSWLSVSGKTISEITTAAGTFRKNSSGIWARAHTITYIVDAAKGTNDSRNPTEYLEGDGALTVYPPTAITGNTFTGWSLSGLLSPDDPTDPAVIPASLLTSDLTLTAQFAGAAGGGIPGGVMGSVSAMGGGAAGGGAGLAASSDSEDDDEEATSSDTGAASTRGMPVRQARSDTSVSFAEGYSDASRALPTEASAKKKSAALWIWLCIGGAVVGALFVVGRVSAARARAEEERFGL